MHRARKRPRAREAAGLALVLACGSAPHREAPPAARTLHRSESSRVVEDTEPYAWQPFTRSPQEPEDVARGVASACPARDAALERAASFAARRELDGKPALDAEDVALVLRAEGSPYVWPRIWT